MTGLFVVRSSMLTVVGTAMLLVTGCAANKAGVTAEKLVVVEKAIDEAREGTARTSAPLELKLAEEKYAAAESALKRNEFDVAIRLADQALADAEYARAKAASAKTRKMADDLTDSITILKDEINRIPGK